MLEKKEVYKCEKCGNVIEGLWDGKPPVSCCGQPMTKLEANTTDAAQEKHVPVITRDGTAVTVKVGSVEHPMTDEHYILFIEVIDGDVVYRKDLKISDSPEAVFTVAGGSVTARAYCNLHGLWKASE